MHYIVYDLEFNQDFPSFRGDLNKRNQYPFEIIQIGAVKLDINFKTISTFNRLVKPTMYSKISPFITKLTGINTEQLLYEKSFPEVFMDFIDFIDDEKSVLCIWGMSDIRELYRNVFYHMLDTELVPKMYINIQSSMSKYLGMSSKKLIKLQSAVETLNIPVSNDFHNALYDAFYTAEVFKRIFNPLVQPKVYNPNYIKVRPRKKKVEIDYDSLLKQFEKMYKRALIKEEQEMIRLAYIMGRTQQFVKN
jgi:DNA polymerase III epsilon subunit-like protein